MRLCAVRFADRIAVSRPRPGVPERRIAAAAAAREETYYLPNVTSSVRALLNLTHLPSKYVGH